MLRVANCRIMWLSFLMGWSLNSVSYAREIVDTVKQLSPTTVAVEWKSDKPEPEASASSTSATGTDSRAVALSKILNARPDSVAFASGTLVSADGLIVTTHLDADPQAKITVTLLDGRKLPARQAVVDRRSGLQLLKIDVADLPAVNIADDDVAMGQEVLSVLCTDLQEREVARGIITATNRTIDKRFYDLLQTDLVTGPMSGGSPVVDMEGRLVGILLAVRASSPQASKASLAVPARYVLDMIKSYQPAGQVTLSVAWLGAAIGEAPNGVSLLKIQEDSPAARAGLQDNDFVVSIDKEPIHKTADLFQEIGKHQPGQQLEIVVRRNEQEQQIKVILGESPISRPVPATSESVISFFQPEVLYAITPDGEIKQIAPTAPGTSNVPPIATTQPPTPKSVLDLLRASSSAQSAVIVQSSDLERKLDALAKSVQALQEQLTNLSDDLKKMREQNQK